MKDLANDEADFFCMHNRKNVHIDVEMLDYDYVNKCTSVDELKGILAMLKSGKEGRYFQLEERTEERLLEVMPEKDRNRILKMKAIPTQNDIQIELESLDQFAKEIEQKSVDRNPHRTTVKRILPPVRGASKDSDNPIPCEPRRFSSTVQKGERKAIKGFDFKAWEKYDVEKAISEIDREDQTRVEEAKKLVEDSEFRTKQRRIELQALPEYIAIESMSSAERCHYALHEKQIGNECFKSGESEDAILYYTRSIAFDDTSAIVYANRALTYLRLKTFENAEQDCSRAISLDPLYVKAWSRRGITRHRRGKYKEAVEDFTKALELDPSSKEILKLLKRSQEKWKEVEGDLHDIKNEAVKDKNNKGISDQESFQHIGVLDKGRSTSFQKIPIMEDDEDEDDDFEEELISPKKFQRFEIIEE